MISSLLLEAARKYQTPLYVYDISKIQNSIKFLKNLFPWQIHYAVKANSNINLLSEIENSGAGFDVVSEGELRRVFQATKTLEKTVFSGVGKKPEEIKYALSNNIKSIHAESLSELRLIQFIAEQMSLIAPVSLRINPDVPAGSHPHIATGIKSSKFGIPKEDLSEILIFLKNAKNIRLIGISCHIGSNVTSLEAYEAAYKELVSVFNFIKREGFKLTLLDLGGGMGISYSGHYAPLDLNQYANIVRQITLGVEAEILIEPGKYIVAEAGVLITKLVHKKNNGEYKFYVVDAGMNDLMRPSLYDSFHKIEVLEPKATETETVDIVGPVCETACYFAKGREISIAEVGDYLAISDAGAYGFSMASNYNSRLRAAEVLIYSDSKVKLIRRREEWDSLWKDEVSEG